MTGLVTQYLKRVLISLSVLLNVLLGGYNNQTFSARNYDWMKRGRANLVKPIDFVLGKDHCMHCWVYWKVRREW
jgi:hypothetical protein